MVVGRKCNRRPFLPNSGALLGVQMFPVCALPRLILSTVNLARSNAWEDEGGIGGEGGAAGFRGNGGQKVRAGSEERVGVLGRSGRITVCCGRRMRCSRAT